MCTKNPRIKVKLRLPNGSIIIRHTLNNYKYNVLSFKQQGTSGEWCETKEQAERKVKWMVNKEKKRILDGYKPYYSPVILTVEKAEPNDCNYYPRREVSLHRSHNYNYDYTHNAMSTPNAEELYDKIYEQEYQDVLTFCPEYSDPDSYQYDLEWCAMLAKTKTEQRINEGDYEQGDYEND